MIAADLCAGAGGLTLGLRQAGVKVEVAVEIDRYAAESYRANFPDVELLECDLCHVSAKSLARKLQINGQSLNILVGGLPCQGFSESNRKTRNNANPRNHLYKEFLRLLRELSPRWFVIENVAGIVTLESGAFLRRMMRAFQCAGYKTVCEILNAADFGIPQIRRRAFLVGNRIGVNFKMPQLHLDHNVPLTVRDAIADLPILRNGSAKDLRDYRISFECSSGFAQSMRSAESESVGGNVVSRNTQLVLARYQHIRPGGNWRSIPRSMMANYSQLERCHTGIYYRLSWNEPSKVIGNFRKNMLIHPSQQRGLSVREAARLQSFPDSHVFSGPLNTRQQQVGDAVPPLLARAVATAIRSADER